MMTFRRVKLAFAILASLGAPAMAQSVDQRVIVVRPANPPPVEDKDGAKIHILGGAALDAGALGRVFGEMVYGVSPGLAEVTLPPEKVAAAARELALAAVRGCQVSNFDVRMVMRNLEKGPWPPFVNFNVSQDTHQNEVLAVGESSIRVIPKGATRSAATVQISLSSSVGPSLDATRTRNAGCTVMVRPQDLVSPQEIMSAVFGERRIGEPKVFDAGEMWTIAAPQGASWPAERVGGASFRTQIPVMLMISQSIREPVVAAPKQ